jgi:hypothetical protein
MSAFNIIVTHTINEERVTENTYGTTNVTRGMVRERAVELAAVNGRKPHETSKSDWENAKQQMTELLET